MPATSMTWSATATQAVGWFAVDALPELSVLRITAEQVRRLFELYTHPEWPAEFD